MQVFHATKTNSPDGVELNFSSDAISIKTYIHLSSPTYEAAQNDDGSFSVAADPTPPAPFDINNIDQNFVETSSAEIRLSDLVNSPQFESGASFNVYLGTKEQNGSLTKLTIVNANAASQSIRGGASDVYRIMGNLTPVMVICVPRMNCTVDDLIVGINTLSGSEASVKCSAQVTKLPEGQDLAVVRAMVRPKFIMAGSAVLTQGASSTFTVNVQKEDGSTDEKFNDPIYFETTGGRLAVSKVKAVNGVAVARLNGSDLIAGDEITVKAGTKFYSSLAKIDINVIA